MKNAISVDVEDYFQVSAFAGQIRREDWEGFDRRVEGNTEGVLELFAEAGVCGTFFTLGWVAERHPELIRRLVDAGHELASHGFEHRRVSEQTPAEFRADIRRTKQVLEDVSGAPVAGYRAASFSISADTLWAFEVLAEEGYRYSSSVYPIRHDHYGMPSAPRFAYQPLAEHALRELPISTVSIFGQRLPCGGGGYFRLLPYGLSKWAIRRVNRLEKQPCIFYFHPWEIDPGQPRVGGLSAKARFRHYTNLGVMRRRLRAVLNDFSWDRIDRVFS